MEQKYVLAVSVASSNLTERTIGEKAILYAMSFRMIQGAYVTTAAELLELLEVDPKHVKRSLSSLVADHLIFPVNL